MPFGVPIFTKLTTAQRHYADIFYTEFHPNRLRHIKNRDRNSLTHLGKDSDDTRACSTFCKEHRYFMSTQQTA